jgi:hypothetical protein
MRIPRWVWVGLLGLAAVAVWVVLTMYAQFWRVPAASNDWLARAGQTGDALGPLGGIATAVALIWGFAQARRNAEQTHLDRLAEAYATWLAGSELKLKQLREAAFSARGLIQRGEPRDSPNFKRAINAVNEACAQTEHLRSEATEVLLFERDVATRKVLDEITKTIWRFKVAPTDDVLVLVQERLWEAHQRLYLHLQVSINFVSRLRGERMEPYRSLSKAMVMDEPDEEAVQPATP